MASGAAAVRESGADLGIVFDTDVDRCSRKQKRVWGGGVRPGYEGGQVGRRALCGCCPVLPCADAAGRLFCPVFIVDLPSPAALTGPPS